MTHSYRPRGVCSSRIEFDLEDGKLYNIRFRGGCDGNLKAIGKLLEGADASFAIEKLKGNDCGGRGTSCADQLTKAIEQALEKQAG